VCGFGSYTEFIARHPDHRDMETPIRTATMQVTVLCLVAAGILLALGLAGAGASLLLIGLFAALTVALYLTLPTSAVGPVLGIDVDSLLNSLWLAPGVVAFVLLLQPGASPAEVQALGGLVGLAGMVNYFMRPVYILAYSAFELLQGLGRDPDA